MSEPSRMSLTTDSVSLNRGLDGFSAHPDQAIRIRETPLAEVVGRIKPIDPAMFELARVLAR